MPSPTGVLTGTLLIAFSLLFTQAHAVAQTARIEGTVIDSLSGMPLAGAGIQIGRSDRRFITDSTGHFQAGSLPAGPQQVRFTHPVLDSLGIHGPVARVELSPGVTTRVSLGTPSGRTFLARLCRPPAAGAPEERSAVLGVVRATDSDEPIPGAAVQLQWATMVADPALGIRRQMQVLNATADPTGVYVLCDAPADAEAALTVAAAGYDTATAELSLGSNAAVVQHVMLAPRPAPGVAGEGATATLTGTVRDEEGRSLDGAEVVIVTRYHGVAAGPAATDAAGRYTLRDAPPGTRIAEVRRLGSSPVRRTVTLASGRVTRLDATLMGQAVVLEEVAVKRSTQLDRNGFTMRRSIGRGRFYTRDDIARENVTVSTDLLDRIPGMRVEGSVVINRSLRRSVRGGACAIGTFLNGVNTPTDYVLNIPRQEIDGVEVYDVASQVPTEYAGPQASCGAILIWTREPR